MKRMLFGVQGSVSVYIIIIIVPIFLFQAIFIDAIRMRLSARETEQALKTGLRSMMSAYSPELRDYGLYGLLWNGGDQTAVWTDVASKNLPVAADSSLRLTDTKLETDGLKVEPVYTLGNRQVFRRQIVQDMKITAPVEFILEMMDKFKKKSTDKALSSVSDFYKEAERLQELSDEREKALDKAWALLDDITLQTRETDIQASADLAKLDELANRIGLVSLDEARQAADDVDKRIQSSETTIDSLRNSLSSSNQTLKELMEHAKENKSRIESLQSEIQGIQSDIDRVNQSIQELMSIREKWKQVLADMAEYAIKFQAAKAAMTAAEGHIRNGYRSFYDAWSEAERIQEDWVKEVEKLRQSQKEGLTLPDRLFSERNAYDSAYFTYYVTGAGKLPAAVHGLVVRWSEVEWWNSGKFAGLKSDLSALEGQLGSFQSTCRAEEQQRAERNESKKDFRKEDEKTIGSVLSGVQHTVMNCGSGETFTPYYDQLMGDQGLYRKYRLDPSVESEPGNGQTAVEEPDQAVKGSMGILDKITGVAAAFRDDFMVHEYILTSFNYRTSGLSSESNGMSRAAPETHPLTHQEAEYALYGFSTCAANQGAAYSEMFLVLLGIRTAEALYKPTNRVLGAGSPLLAVIAAAAQGAVQAYGDMAKLTAGQNVPLFREWQQAVVSYKDFLRLFMLLHGNEQAMLARTQALTELNTGIDLKQAVTYARGTAPSSVRLWFLPSIMKALETAGFSWKIEEGRYLMKKTVVYSYD